MTSVTHHVDLAFPVNERPLWWRGRSHVPHVGNSSGNRGRKVSLSPLWCASPVYTCLLCFLIFGSRILGEVAVEAREDSVSRKVNLSISNLSVVILPFLVQNWAGNLETVHWSALPWCFWRTGSVSAWFWSKFYSFLFLFSLWWVKSLEIMLMRCKLTEFFGSQSLSCVCASVGG
jgi:hypothetical protein